MKKYETRSTAVVMEIDGDKALVKMLSPENCKGVEFTIGEEQLDQVGVFYKGAYFELHTTVYARPDLEDAAREKLNEIKKKTLEILEEIE